MREFPTATASALSAASADSIIVELKQYGLIAVSGEDAGTFLHSQLTNSVADLRDDQARLAAYCSAKGRMQASFFYWRQDGVTLLMCDASLREAVQKRLSMFVLRAKARLSDAGDAYRLLGLAGDTVPALLTVWFPALPQLPWEVVRNEYGALMRLVDAAGRPRWLWSAPNNIAGTVLPALQAGLTTAPKEVWDWLEIRAGIPWITQATFEQFVPQMVNFEVLGGIDFKKGCYPGQEVVARTQYRGTVKRRMQLAHVDTADGLAVGDELFHTADASQPCGMVVNLADAPDGSADLLAQVKLDAMADGSVHVGAPQGPTLRWLPLPYSLPADA